MMRINIMEMLDIKGLVDTMGQFDHIKKDVLCVFRKDPKIKADGIIFLKPELCSLPPDKLFIILEHFQNMTKLYSITLLSGYIVSGDFLAKNKIMEKIYKEIRKHALISSYKQINKENLLNIQSMMGNFDRILGGLTLIKRGYSSDFLMDLWINSGEPMKILDDFYVAPGKLEGKQLLLVNGFYPYQVGKYKANESRIIYFSFKTKKDFGYLKKYFQGSADREKRHKKSFRQFLSEFMELHRAGIFTASQNGIHLSATGQEGAREVKIFTESLKGF